MTKHQKNVQHFMQLACQNLPDKPTIPDAKIRELRCRLIMEEALEACNALGFNVFCKTNDPIKKDGFDFHEILDKQISLSEIAKELADLGVVGEDGTGLACGIDMEIVRDLVDENNLGKFGPGSYKDEYGKHCKPKNYPKPDIQKEIDRQVNEFHKEIFHHSV